MSLRLLDNILIGKQVTEYVAKLRQNKPILRYGIERYNVGERYYDSSTAYIRTYTCKQYKNLNYKFQADWTTDLPQSLSKNKLSVLCLTNDLIFFDHKTYNDYQKEKDQMRLQMIEMGKYDDTVGSTTRYDTVGSTTIADFHNYSIYAHYAKDLPFWMRKTYFWLAQLLFVGYFYHWILRSKFTSVYNHQLTKVISKYKLIDEDKEDLDSGDQDKYKDTPCDDLDDYSEADNNYWCSEEKYNTLRKHKIIEY